MSTVKIDAMNELIDIYRNPNYVLKGGHIKDLFDYLRQIV